MSLVERYKTWRQARRARAMEKLERNLSGVPLRESIRATRSKVISESRRLPGGPFGPVR